MLVRVNRASSWNDVQPCSKAEFKSVVMYDRRIKTTMEKLKSLGRYYEFMSQGTNHREEYDKFNNPCCIRELQQNIWVLKITSLKALDALIDEVGSIVIQPEDRYKGIDYSIIIYDDYIE